MKQLTKLMTRLRRRKPRRQDKHGSSMALVMIITSALVIWVMCLAPLMSTTGITALKVQNGYTDYLGSRSAIEYAKSELEFIVRSGSPYTFAVIEKNDGTYDTVAKTASNYSSYVTSQDEPNMNVLGSDVAAISTVIGPDNSGRYEILIKSYNNGEKGLSFRVKFQETGSLMIVPEVYEQTAALPINDFVLVDGKLGQNDVWKSNIDYDLASGGLFDLFTYKGYVRFYNSANNRYTTNDIYHVEMLKPWKLNYEADTPYANAGEYPAVFKATAQSATGTLNIDGTPLVEQQYSKEDWILPFSPLEEGGSNNDVGAVWIKLYKNNCYQVFLKTKTSEENITSKCTLYLNGTSVKPTSNDNNPYFDVSKLITKAYNAYRITVDYAGSDPNNKYNTDENALNALGRNGMIVKEFAGDMTAIKNKAVSIEPTLNVSMSNDGSTMTVTVTDVDVKKYPDAQFYSTATGAWQHSNQFIIDNFSEIHYFYAYVPSRMENGAITPDSGVKCAGGVAGFGKYTNMAQLDSDKDYWIMNSNGYAMQSGSNNSLGAHKFIADGSPTAGGYVSFDTNTGNDIYESAWWDNFKWKADKLDSKDTKPNLIYQGNNYLNLTASLEATYWTQDGRPTDYEKSYEYNDYTVSLVESKNPLTFAEDKNHIFYYKVDNNKEVYSQNKSGNGCSGYEYTYTPSHASYETNSYLNINDDGSISASDKETAVYFVEVPKWTNNPSMPDAPPPDDAGRQVTDDFSLSNWDELFANGASIQSVNELGPGNYILTGFSDTHYLVCEYSVGKTNQTGSISVDYVANPNDECTVTITGTSGNDKSGGVRYIGYKELKENEETTYHWFPTADNEDGTYSTTITIRHGKYEFMFKESGNSNYNSQEVLYQDPKTKEYVATIDYMYVEFAEDAFQSVTWTYKDGVETFYLPLPDGVTFGRLKLVFGTPGASGQSNDISWSINPSRETRYYGVIVENSNFEEIPNVLQLPQPLPLTNNNGHTSSLIRGKSVYLMNERASINTYNNVIYIDTDLLVLNSSIVSTSADGLQFDENNEIDANNTAFLTPDDASFEARVLVKPYSKGRLPNGEPRQVLLFAAENIVNSDRKTIVFEKNCYYLIPANTDIYNLNPSTAADYKVGCYAPGQEANNMQSVANLFSNRYYPEINYDIAFATSTQLNQVISGETVGWTRDGKLLGGSDKYGPFSILNENFAVAAYITSPASNSITRNANRVLLAAPSTLEVQKDVRFTTRYLSIDAPVVNGTNSNVEFIVANMGDNDSFLEGIGKYFTSLFGYKINYSSKTLQIDFEQKTKITLGGAEVDTYDPQICRYSNGANLFANQPLMSIMAPYTAKEIMDLNPKADNSGIMIVDRYIELSADSAQPSLTLAQAKTMNVNVYSNYIHITNSVSAIDITTNQKTGKSGFILNSQEYGYSSNEYMGLFIVPAGEAFSGTLLRIDGYGNTGKLQVMADGFDSPKPIPRGFYFVPATDEGTPISAIAQAIEANDGDPTKTAYWVSEDKLREYAVIIDNESSSTYVDTGLWGSGGTGSFSNFYGGTVE